MPVQKSLSKRETADLLGIAPQTLDRKSKKFEAPQPAFFLGSHPRWLAEDIEAWLDAEIAKQDRINAENWEKLDASLKAAAVVPYQSRAIQTEQPQQQAA